MTSASQQHRVNSMLFLVNHVSVLTCTTNAKSSLTVSETESNCTTGRIKSEEGKNVRPDSVSTLARFYSTPMSEDECVQECIDYRYCVGVYYTLYYGYRYCTLYYNITDFNEVSEHANSAPRTIMVDCGMYFLNRF